MYKLLFLLFLVSCGSVYIEDINPIIDPAPIKTYEIGEIGPSGGWIFYKNPVQKTGNWKYLELSNIDYEFSRISWDSSIPPIYVNTSSEIGDGLSNTQKIFETLSVTNDYLYAALACIELELTYEGKSFSNWFLPSIKELELVFTNLFLNDYADLSDKTTYYSSSEANNILGVSKNLVWVQHFDSRYIDPVLAQDTIVKNTISTRLLIRCARFVY